MSAIRNYVLFSFKNACIWGGAWVALSVEHPTPDLSSGLGLRVLSSSPTLGSTLGMEPTYKMQNLRSHPRLVLSQNLHFHKMPRWFLSPSKFEKLRWRGCDLLTNKRTNLCPPVVVEAMRTDFIYTQYLNSMGWGLAPSPLLLYSP